MIPWSALKWWSRIKRRSSWGRRLAPGEQGRSWKTCPCPSTGFFHSCFCKVSLNISGSKGVGWQASLWWASMRTTLARWCWRTRGTWTVSPANDRSTPSVRMPSAGDQNKQLKVIYSWEWERRPNNAGMQNCSGLTIWLPLHPNLALNKVKKQNWTKYDVYPNRPSFKLWDGFQNSQIVRRSLCTNDEHLQRNQPTALSPNIFQTQKQVGERTYSQNLTYCSEVLCK